MDRHSVLAAMGLCAALAWASSLHAQAMAPASTGAARLSLLGAAFAKDDAPPTSPQQTTAMAFLPGRGVVAWDVTGKTSAEASEAQIEAMGLADAQAVQREIDAAEGEQRAEQEREAMRRASSADAGAQRVTLNMPAITGSPREAFGALPLNRAARSGGVLNVRSGETLRDKARLYAFAAASGRGVGLNALHDDAGWKNAGLTADQGGFTGQRQAGLAWRKGLVQTSVSYMQQKNRTEILGIQTDKDHRVMLTMNMPPQAVLGLFSKRP